MTIMKLYNVKFLNGEDAWTVGFVFNDDLIPVVTHIIEEFEYRYNRSPFYIVLPLELSILFKREFMRRMSSFNLKEIILYKTQVISSSDLEDKILIF